jgi:hypothetical protein
MHSQDISSCNCLIFIDGKVSENIHVTLIESSILETDTIYTDYTIGNIEYSLTDTIQSESLLDIEIEYYPKGLNQVRMHFKSKIRFDWLDNSYLIFNVTTLNKKKDKYHVSIITPGAYSVAHKKEHELFEY